MILIGFSNLNGNKFDIRNGDGLKRITARLNTWSAEVTLFDEQENLKWLVRKRTIKKLVRIWENLENRFEYPRLTECRYKGFCIRFGEEIIWFGTKNVVISVKGNLFEARKDVNKAFVNEVLRSSPFKILREILIFRLI